MSGHSRWAGIKHKKAVVDAKRGKIFTSLIREVTVAARHGGGNPENNPRLRKAIEDSRNVNMPAENIKRAIARGTGELPGAVIEETTYEGYGPGGVAVFIEATTDNRNRTTSDIRRVFSSNGGNLGESGCVAWMFSQQGYIAVDKKAAAEEKLMNLAIEAGAEDFKSDDDEIYEITTQPHDFEKIKSALSTAKVPLVSAELTRLAQTYVPLAGKEAEHMLNLMNELEAHEDVKEVYANFDIPKEIIDKVTT